MKIIITTAIVLILYCASTYAATYDGTLTNMADPPTSTSGWQTTGCVSGQNNCIGFDVNTPQDYVSLPTSIPNVGTSSATVMGWVKTSATTGQYIYMTSGTDGWSFIVMSMSSTGKIRFNVRDTTHYEISGGVFDSTGTINNGAWHHIACVWDTTGNAAYIYIDGNASGTATGLTSINNVIDNSTKSLGGSTGGYFNGYMDGVAIFNTALSQTTIRTYCGWNESACVGYQHTGLESGLVSAWRFNQSSGVTAYSTTSTQTSQSLTYSDTASLSDTFSYQHVPGGNPFSGADTVSLAEGFVWSINRYLTDSVGLSESFVKTSTISMALSDNIGLTDSLGISSSVLCINCRRGGTKRKHEIIQ